MELLDGSDGPLSCGGMQRGAKFAQCVQTSNRKREQNNRFSSFVWECLANSLQSTSKLKFALTRAPKFHASKSILISTHILKKIVGHAVPFPDESTQSVVQVRKHSEREQNPPRVRCWCLQAILTLLCNFVATLFRHNVASRQTGWILTSTNII